MEQIFYRVLFLTSDIFRIRVDDNIIFSGLWPRKTIEDWNEKHISIDRSNGCNVDRIRNIIKEIPEGFYGKGYYS
jgi:hypothetical protein